MPETAASAVKRLAPKIVGDLATGNGIAFLGDSITAADQDNANGIIGSRSYGVMACMMSGGRLRFVRNAGISGNTTAQMLARIQTDVIAYDPDICVVLGGTNDIGQSVAQSTIRANLIAIYRALRRAGIQPVACTVTPRSQTTGTLAVEQINAWIRLYASRHGIPLADFAAVLTDPTSFGWLGGGTTYNDDGLHPNYAGQRIMATELVNALDLSGLLPRGTPYLDLFGQTTQGGANLVFSGCFQADSNADGVADQWTLVGSATGATISRNTVSGFYGKTQRCVYSTAVQRYFSQTITTGFAVGDRIAFAGKFTTSGIEAGGLKVHAQLLFTNATGTPTSLIPLRNFTLDVNQWVFYAEGVVPAGTTALTVQLIGTVDGTGTVEWGQITVVNLTAQGLA